MRLPLRRPLRRPLGRPRRLLPTLAAGIAGVLVLSAAGGGVPTSAAPAPAASDGDRLLAAAAHGRSAVEALGPQLARAAEVNGMATRDLRRLLEEDDTVWLGSTGRVFYRDRRDTSGAPADRAATTAAYPHSQTFLLHSKPGSQRTIHLDFDGATVTGSEWNRQGLQTTPLRGYSLDADASTFSAAEHAAIQSIWERVADDYAPFDVDVTTEQPAPGAIDRSGPGDQVFGTTALVTGERAAAQAICDVQCTGVGFMDVFDLVTDHRVYQPALVFTAEHSDVFNITETISHEVGHNFGLKHHGRSPNEEYYAGHGPWVPIMGSGYGPITQWSNGSYAGASNPGQDDVAVIARSGAPVRADDAGDRVSAAAPLPASTAVISTRDDVDVYRLGTCSGALTLTAGVSPSSPDLDVELSLLDTTGAVVASADPASGMGDGETASGMGATLERTVPAGQYFARIDGVGNGTPSSGYDDYGSLGRYTLSATGCTTGSDPGPGPDPEPEPEPEPQPEATAPDAPGIGKATSGRRGRPLTATARWSAPAADGGAPVTAYVVLGHKMRGNGTVRKTYESDPLDPGTTRASFRLGKGRWSFSVVAVNEVGESAPSARSRTVRAR